MNSLTEQLSVPNRVTTNVTFTLIMQTATKDTHPTLHAMAPSLWPKSVRNTFFHSKPPAKQFNLLFIYLFYFIQTWLISQ